MDTSYLRDQLAHRVTGEVYAGTDPAAAIEAAAFNTSVTHRAGGRGRGAVRRGRRGGRARGAGTRASR